ncbi:MAG: hypothetical protein HY976_03135 [Candidatus Kerfeldbacteria bacterium]|nr:hypothetical protein [Candidatus Kerfeldbacteria bacterium]
MNKDQRGIGLISTLLVFSLVSAFLAAVGLVLSQERARVRDSHRIVDMIRVQYAFETLYREKASYTDAAAGCNEVGKTVATCALSTYLPQIANLRDPGRQSYRVELVPNDRDYAISFVLERGYDTLAAGKHFLSKNGIQ